MKKYSVRIAFRAVATYIVEADNFDDAREQARDCYLEEDFEDSEINHIEVKQYEPG